MNFVKLKLNNNNYSYAGSSSIKMDILGLFLSSDVQCFGVSGFKKWALANKLNKNSEYGLTYGGNVTNLEEEGIYIYLSSGLPLEKDEKLVELKMPKEQFIKLLDEWEEKACKAKPKEVTITEKNGEFIFETKN
jgi:hypothetical protein